MTSAAEQFSLNLGSKGPLVAKTGASAFCLVTSASLQFATEIREKIRFAVTRRIGTDQVKQKVANRQDLCCLSQDQKQFKFGFDLESPGIYKVGLYNDFLYHMEQVVVMLGDQHVKNSPLKFSVAEMQAENLGSEETDKVSAWLQNLQLPAESPASPPDPFVVAGGDTQSDVRDLADKKLHNTGVEIKGAERKRSANINQPKMKSEVGHLLVTGLVQPKPFPKLFSIKDGEGDDELKNPIGLCLLNNGTLVVASTRGDKVKMFAANGKLATTVTLPSTSFSRPSDMTALSNGNFVVRDNKGIHEFGGDGTFLRHLSAGRVDRGTKCFGLAQDEEGRLVTVVETWPSSALLFIDLKKDEVVVKRDLVKERVGGSKCRFLSHSQGKLYVTDLGLNKIYVVDAKSGVCERTIKGPERDGLNDPAGVGVDEEGGLIVADSRNHRICLFSADGRFLVCFYFVLNVLISSVFSPNWS